MRSVSWSTVYLAQESRSRGDLKWKIEQRWVFAMLTTLWKPVPYMFEKISVWSRSAPAAHQVSLDYPTLLPTRNTFCNHSSRSTEPSTYSTCLVSIRFPLADPSQLLIELTPCHTDQCAEQKRYQCELCRTLVRPWKWDIAKHKKSHDLEGNHRKRGYSCCEHRFTEDSLRGHLALCLPGCTGIWKTELVANTPSDLQRRVRAPRTRTTAQIRVVAPIYKRTLLPRPPTVESFDVSLSL
jgi:hypothetical protein